MSCQHSLLNPKVTQDLKCEFCLKEGEKMDELKPCPFCGKPGLRYHPGKDSGVICVNPECTDGKLFEDWQNAYCWKELEDLRAQCKELLSKLKEARNRLVTLEETQVYSPLTIESIDLTLAKHEGK